jgi:hypothetical protein
MIASESICQHLTKRAATVLNVKAVAGFYWVGNEKELDPERPLVAHHRIEDSKKLSHASCESDLLQFASFQ